MNKPQKFTALILGTAAVPGILIALCYALGIWPNLPGWLNIAFASSIVCWYLLDGLFPRRTIYRLYRRTESPFLPEIRFWRKVALLASSMLGLAAAAIALADPGPGEVAGSTLIAIPQSMLTPMFLLASAFLAAFGWMFTSLEKQKADRATATSQVIHNQIYDPSLASMVRLIRAAVIRCRALYKIDNAGQVPLEAMNIRMRVLARLPDTSEFADVPFSYVVDLVLNALDHLAFGVRQGQYELRTVEMVLRPRMIRYAYVFSDYIRDSTVAVYDAEADRFIATDRTWEHLLWLVSRMAIMKSDKVERNQLVLPPAEIIAGT